MTAGNRFRGVIPAEAAENGEKPAGKNRTGRDAKREAPARVKEQERKHEIHFCS